MISSPRLAPLRLVPAIAAAAALLAGGSALAQSGQRFVYMAEAQSGIGFIDPASVRASGAYKSADLLMVIRPAADTPPTLAYAVVTVEFDCAGKRSHIVNGSIFGPDGASLGGGATPDRPFTPDDLNEPDTAAVYGVVCQGKAPAGPFKGTAAEAYQWAKPRL